MCKPQLNSSNTIFTTKANTLTYLKNELKKSIIEDLFFFTVRDWKKRKDEILKHITQKFNSPIIIRSSAIGEDSITSSKAGNYTSVLDISPRKKDDVSKAIEAVILSYSTKSNQNSNNQILIQTQTSDTITSGVVFTRTNDIGSPYYVINYEDGKSTTGVTQGQINDLIKIQRNFIPKTLPKKWKILLTAIREIEKISNSTHLDIEFGIKKNFVPVIFQVRPLTYNVQKNLEKIDSKVEKLIMKNKKKFQQLLKSDHLFGKRTVFSDMADWNPSEIIGPNPNLLDYSLYDFLIMKKSWHEGRKILGYQNINPCSLMVKFGNKPYVDIRASFNSLIPDNVEKKLKNKLLNFYISSLESHPELHDKVEFEILFTCYDFSLSNRLSKLLNHGFDQKELERLKNNLRDFTNDIINNFSDIEKKSDVCYSKMTENRKKILSSIKNSKDYHNLLEAAEKLLQDCKRYGTIQFSGIARIAFIASILLKSLVKQGKISSSQYDLFLESIQSPLSSLRNDFSQYTQQKISLDKLMEKYGHLRSGTYDITAPRYDKNPDLISNFHFIKRVKTNKKFTEPNLSKTFSNHGLKFKSTEFFSFVRTSISKREEIKFEFTRNLSDALELIAKAGQILGFSREQMSNLDIKTIFYYKKLHKKELEKMWKRKIFTQQNKKRIADHLHLPPFISSKENFEIFSYFISKPNFITRKKITSDIVVLDNTISSKDVSKKIVVIENADPGFDWIFINNIAGLITKYGGIASHMAIRCSELGIPAAIGCGEILFEKLLESKKVLLDCEQKQVIIMKTKKKDEYFEEKKVLKSLGYIK